MEIAGRLTPEEFWAHVAYVDDRIRATATQLPVYGVVGWTGPVSVGDWEFEDGRLVVAGLVHGTHPEFGPRLDVITTHHDSDWFIRRLRGELDPIGLSAESGAAEPFVVDVDGVPVEFARWREDDHWWAAAPGDSYSLVLEARAVDGSVALAQVHDLEPYLAGRRAMLRKLRGE